MNLKKLISSVLLMFTFAFTQVQADDIKLKTKETTISINDKGCFSSINVDNKEILKANTHPLIIGCVNQQLIYPNSLTRSKDILKIKMTDGENISIKYQEHPNCVTFEMLEVPAKYEAVVIAPIQVNISEIVGDIIGVAQGNGVAFGIQALNIKTMAGIPQEYGKIVTKNYAEEGQSAELSVASIPISDLAAARIKNGTVFHFSCKRRNELEYRTVFGLENAMVLPVEGADALINGAKVALFGCSQKDALNRIGEIEIEQNLPHPMFDGEWGKTSQKAMGSYLISNFSEDDLDFVLEKSKRAGFEYIYHSDPFIDWGHFNWSPKFTKSGDEGVKRMVDKAKSHSIKMGVHTLTNFTTTSDKYVTPIPSENLLKQGILTLIEDIDESQTTIKIKHSELFKRPVTLNAIQIGNELIKYQTVKEEGDIILLEQCTRGAWETTATKHTKSKPMYKLWDYPYKTFFPDLKLQDKFTDRLVEIFNKTGLAQISLDGLEGCSYTGHDEYAVARFTSRFYGGLKHNVLNDASRLHHYMWHINTRMNWGEPWGEAMRTGQVESRIKNQDFFYRNLFPRMLGWFLIRLSDKKFECTTLEDLEWALSESAGFDAGYAMNINMNTLQKHGQIDLLLEGINNWDKLRNAKAFTKEQMLRLKDPKTEWRLEKRDNNSFNLFPLYISKYFRCDLTEMQPGQPGGADWAWDNDYEGQFAFRLLVRGDYIQDPSFTTSKGVIKFPCKINNDEYLLYGFDGKAFVTDKNYNVISEVTPMGVSSLPKGSSAVSFSCISAADGDEAPEVAVRYMTKGSPEVIKLP